MSEENIFFTQNIKVAWLNAYRHVRQQLLLSVSARLQLCQVHPLHSLHVSLLLVGTSARQSLRRHVNNCLKGQLQGFLLHNKLFLYL